MSRKQQSTWAETVLNATTGYVVVVLGIVCFVLSLTVIAAIVRFVVGLGMGAGA